MKEKILPIPLKVPVLQFLWCFFLLKLSILRHSMIKMDIETTFVEM